VQIEAKSDIPNTIYRRKKTLNRKTSRALHRNECVTLLENLETLQSKSNNAHCILCIPYPSPFTRSASRWYDDSPEPGRFFDPIARGRVWILCYFMLWYVMRHDWETTTTSQPHNTSLGAVETKIIAKKPLNFFFFIYRGNIRYHLVFTWSRLCSSMGCDHIGIPHFFPVSAPPIQKSSRYKWTNAYLICSYIDQIISGRWGILLLGTAAFMRVLRLRLGEWISERAQTQWLNQCSQVRDDMWSLITQWSIMPAQ
jgi:hypothetical protein